MYAVVGDFNDTPESPWVAPLVNSPHLKDILSRYRALNDRWTYYYRSRNRVTQIDYILASKALTRRISDAVQAGNLPYIERRGLGYRKLNASGKILPEKANVVHFEPDVATPPLALSTPSSKVSFRFTRYPEVFADWTRNISDHCPVKVWF